MLQEAGVDILLHTFVAGVIADGDHIQSLVLEDKSGRQAATSAVYIDCTGDGDVAAAAGVPWEKGDADGHLQPPTLMFTMRSVDPEAAREAILSQPDMYHTFSLSREQVAENDQAACRMPHPFANDTVEDPHHGLLFSRCSCQRVTQAIRIS